MSMTDVELQEHCIRAASQYLTERHGHVSDLERKHLIVNTFGHGFGAGMRYAEKLFSAKPMAEGTLGEIQEKILKEGDQWRPSSAEKK